MDSANVANGSFACFALRTPVDLPGGKSTEIAAGITAQTHPPFEMDEFWKKELGNLECEKITNSNFFLCAFSDEGADPHTLTSSLHSYYYGLLILGRGYNGYPVNSTGTILGGAYSSDGVGSVSTIGDMLIHFRPWKVIQPNITAEDLPIAAVIAKGIDTIYADTSGGAFLRLRKGFSAYISATQKTEAHERLHQFVRSIEAVVKPKLWGGNNFKFRCQMFGGRTPADEEILGDLYEMRSAAEHFVPLKEKLERFPEHERKEVILNRVFQVELIAQHVYRTILSDEEYYQHFESDDLIDALWKQSPRDLIKFWGDPIDLKDLEKHNYHAWLE